jgi:hypothetical protein
MIQKPAELTAIVPTRTPIETSVEYLTIFMKGMLGVLPVGTLLNEMFFESRSRENFRRFVHHVEETRRLTQEELTQLRESVDGFEQKLAERSESIEAQGLMWNYTEQAMREPMLERQFMLEHAHAAIVDVRLSVAEHARVQRRLGEIEPDDVITLFAITRTFGRVYEGKEVRSEPELRYAFWKSRPNAEALAAAGCVQLEVAGGGFGTIAANALVVTDFGGLVLRVLRGYCRKRGVKFDIPGREHLAGSRTAEEAREVMAGYPGLRAAIARHALTETGNVGIARYMAPYAGHDPDINAVVQPPARGAARLDLYKLTRTDVEAIQAIAPYVPSRDDIMHGRPRESIAVQISQTQGTEYWTAMVHGPHDVLRHVADALDIVWL